MKIIAVGDIHGRETWKQVLAQEKDYDKFIFVGDYFDAFPPMTVEQIRTTFKEIMAFKAAYPDKVVLCIGNHDFQYMPVSGGTEHYSGYNPMTQIGLQDIGEWWKWLTPAYQHGDILFTHAGLTNSWTKRWGIDGFAPTDAAEEIQNLFYKQPEAFKFFDGDDSNCGENVQQGPFWVRPESLMSDPYPLLRMVVGHTFADGVDSVGPITMIDTGKQGEYLKVIDGIFHTGTI